MHHPKGIIVAALVSLLGVFASGCATSPIPDPKTKDGSLLIVGFRIEMESALNTQKYCGQGPLFVRHISGKDAPQTIEHSSNLANYPDCYYYFSDLAPGTYEIDHFILATPGGPVFTFPAEIVARTRIEVKPNSVHYMADYSGRFKQSMMLTTPHKLLETTGGRTSATAAKAIEVFNANYPQSPWLRYPIVR